MHPWMLEQVACEHRRDLLARARTGGRAGRQPAPARRRWHRQTPAPPATRRTSLPFIAAVRSWPRLRVLR